jgi:hypothetical protein
MVFASLRTLGRGCAWILLVQLAAVSPASAERTQAQLTATFKDRNLSSLPKVEPVPACTVYFTEVVDERRSPEMAGVVEQRGVLAPKDVTGWLRAVLNGLTARGIQPSFGTVPLVEAALPAAHFILQTAWIASTEVTYSANVVVRLKASAADRSLDQTYRGRVSRTAYWSGGVDTLQSAMDGAFAAALDAMAVDLRRICESSPTGGG